MRYICIVKHKNKLEPTVIQNDFQDDVFIVSMYMICFYNLLIHNEYEAYTFSHTCEYIYNLNLYEFSIYLIRYC